MISVVQSVHHYLRLNFDSFFSCTFQYLLAYKQPFVLNFGVCVSVFFKTKFIVSLPIKQVGVWCVRNRCLQHSLFITLQMYSSTQYRLIIRSCKISKSCCINGPVVKARCVILRAVQIREIQIWSLPEKSTFSKKKNYITEHIDGYIFKTV